MRRYLRAAFASVLLVASAVISAPSSAEADSRGTDFWVMFPKNYVETPALTLYISGDTATIGTVDIPGIDRHIPFEVTPGIATSILIPSEVEAEPDDGVEDKGIRIRAQEEVSVCGLNHVPFSTDAFLALPTDVLGTEHIILTFPNTNIVNGTEFGIVATEDATNVTITPSVTTEGHLAGAPYSVLLNTGQTYQLINSDAAPADLSGTVVTSDKPVAVFGAHQCANVPDGDTLACDHLVEQLPPTSAWGRSFVTTLLATRQGDTLRIIAQKNGTRVSINGEVAATLNRGQVYQQIIRADAEITATEPVLVAQYSNGTRYDGVTGDPLMMLVPPHEQFLTRYTVNTPTSGFAINYINVVAPEAGKGSVFLDNALVPEDLFHPIWDSGFYGAQLNVDLGSHTLSSSIPFGIHIYGFASCDSYGYPGGMSSMVPRYGADTASFLEEFDNLASEQWKGVEFYIGHLGSGNSTCNVVIDAHNNDYRDIFSLITVDLGTECRQFAFNSALQAGHEKTYGYWTLYGPRGKTPDQARKWGEDQAWLLINQRRRYEYYKDEYDNSYKPFMFGRTLFADIEEGGDWHEDACYPSIYGLIPNECPDAEKLKANEDVFEGFIETLVDNGYVPGVYTNMNSWLRFFSSSYAPRYTKDSEEGLYEKDQQIPLAVWITSCCAHDSQTGFPTLTQAHNESKGALDAIVGGSQAVIWQYYIPGPSINSWPDVDVDITYQNPSVRFMPKWSPGGPATRICSREVSNTLTVAPGATVSIAVVVPAGQAEARFQTNWPGSDVVMTLITPSGRVIDRESVAPDVEHSVGATFEQYVITQPEPGEWTVSLFGADVPPEGEPVEFSFTSTPEQQPDSTPPVITPDVQGTAGANGWHVSDVTVTFDVSDPESGVASSSGCDPMTLTRETTGQTLTCTATNGTGLASEASVTLKIDKTGPLAALAVVAGNPGTNGWYVSDVTVGTSGSDPISAPVQCTADQSLTDETTGLIFSGSCTNDAGLTTQAGPLSVKLDKTPPVMTIVEPAAPTYMRDSVFNVIFDAQDATSGVEVASATLDGEPVTNGQAIDAESLALGPHELVVTALNHAGLETAQTRAFRVLGAPICTDLVQPVTYVEGGFAPACDEVIPEPGKLTLVDSRCHPTRFVSVSLRDADGRLLARRKTNAEGVADFSRYHRHGVPSRFNVRYHGGTLMTESDSYDTGVVVQTQEYSLKLIGSDCGPIPGARVSLKTARNRYVTYTRTNTKGMASFEILYGAKMKLEVEHNGGRWRSEAKPANVDVILGAEAFRIRVIDSGGDPVKKASVGLHKAKGRIVNRAWTDAEGLTSFDVLPDAPLKAVVAHCGRKYATQLSASHELETVQVDRCSRWGGPWRKRSRWTRRGGRKR